MNMRKVLFGLLLCSGTMGFAAQGGGNDEEPLQEPKEKEPWEQLRQQLQGDFGQKTHKIQGNLTDTEKAIEGKQDEVKELRSQLTQLQEKQSKLQREVASAATDASKNVTDLAGQLTTKNGEVTQKQDDLKQRQQELDVEQKKKIDLRNELSYLDFAVKALETINPFASSEKNRQEKDKKDGLFGFEWTTIGVASAATAGVGLVVWSVAKAVRSSGKKTKVFVNRVLDHATDTDLQAALSYLQQQVNDGYYSYVLEMYEKTATCSKHSASSRCIAKVLNNLKSLQTKSARKVALALMIKSLAFI